MKKIVLRAGAKINLGLSVEGRRPDGYHDIRTLMHSVELSDVIFFSTADGVTVECPGINGEDNTVTKAVRVMEDLTGRPLGIRASIEKHVPMQAGLGGGSADAAAALVALDRLYGLGMSREELERAGAMVGADVPFLIRGGLSLCEGIGDRLTHLAPLSGMPVLIVKGELSVDTSKAYSFMDSVTEKEEYDPERILSSLREQRPLSLPNSFEEYIKSVSPGALGTKEALLGAGAFAAGLSGSGACFYGLFRDESEMLMAKEKLSGSFGFICGTRLSGPSGWEEL